MEGSQSEWDSLYHSLNKLQCDKCFFSGITDFECTLCKELADKISKQEEYMLQIIQIKKESK
jgi:hypothetical protein